MKKKGLRQAKARVEKNIVRKMLNMPFCAYWVQISTTRLESAIDAFSALSSLMLALMNSKGRYAPVATAGFGAQVTKLTTEPPVIRQRRKRGLRFHSFPRLSGCKP